MTGNLVYAVIQVSDERRGERLNAGLAIFTKTGLDVRIPRRLEKLRAMSNALDFDSVRSAIDALIDSDRYVLSLGVSNPAERLARISSTSPFGFSDLATFAAPTADAYENLAKRLLAIFVEPEPAPASKSIRRTRLSSSVRKLFRDRRILARQGEGLGAHRVVANVQIADGLAADFVLQNGAMHVIETVDASSDVISLRKAVSEIAVSALVLEQARMTYGERKTLGRLVYDASAVMEKLAAPSLEAAAHQGAQLVNWASHDDRRRLIDQLAQLADPLPSAKSGELLGIHASAQGRLKLH